MDIYKSKLGAVVSELRSETRQPQSYYERVLERVETIDDELNAFVPDAVIESPASTQVVRQQQRWADDQFLPPLYAVPVGVKDVFRVNEFPTQAGSSLPPETLAGPESTVVSRLKAAGAVILGKTVTTTFTHLPTGKTRNPHARTHTPGGSSSGSAAAVAAGLCPLTIGSETTGSVIRPATYCGVVGFRPTHGRVPFEGTISLAPTVDTIGCFTQDLTSVQHAASTLCRHWSPIIGNSETSTIGVPTGPYLRQASADGLRRFDRQVRRLETAGVDIERVEFFSDIKQTNGIHRALISAEAAVQQAAWYTEHADSYPEAMVELLERGERVSNQKLGKAKQSIEQTRNHIESVMNKKDIDVVVTPPTPDVAPAGLDDDGDPVMNLPWAHAGVPALTLPVGSTNDGLPIGIGCVGRFGHDESLLSHAETVRAVLINTSR